MKIFFLKSCTECENIFLRSWTVHRSLNSPLLLQNASFDSNLTSRSLPWLCLCLCFLDQIYIFIFCTKLKLWKLNFSFLYKISEKHFPNFFCFYVTFLFLMSPLPLLFSPLRPIRKKHFFQLLPECFLSILLSSRFSKISSKLFRLLN